MKKTAPRQRGWKKNNAGHGRNGSDYADTRTFLRAVDNILRRTCTADASEKYAPDRLAPAGIPLPHGRSRTGITQAYAIPGRAA